MSDNLNPILDEDKKLLLTLWLCILVVSQAIL